MSIVKKQFNTREWVFLSLIFMLTQAGIWYAAFVNAGNGSALNYVSFAGTLVSIILAILAIGYTYGESLSEKNKSETIANQVYTLNEVVGRIRAETSNLDSISTINSELLELSKKFREGISDTHKKVDSVEIKLNDLKGLLTESSNSKGKKAVSNNDVEIDKKSLAKSFVNTNIALIEIPLLAMYNQNNKEHEGPAKFMDHSLINIIKELKEEDEDNYFSDDIINIFGGSFLSLWQMLIELKLINQEDKKVVFSEELKEQMELIVNKENKFKTSANNKLRDKIVSIIKKNNQ